MIEQVMGVVSAEVDEESQRIALTGTLGAETLGASPDRHRVAWSVVKSTTGQVHLIEERPKTLTERFNEAYDEEAKREDEEFVKNLKRYHRRRFSDEW
jgi:hypothetical protein